MIAFILICAAVTAVSVPAMISKRLKRELIVFSALLLCAFVFVLIKTVWPDFPSPTQIIRHFLENLLGLSYKHIK